MITITFTRTKDMPNGTVLFTLKREGQRPYSDLLRDGDDVEEFQRKLNRGRRMMAEKKGELT